MITRAIYSHYTKPMLEHPGERINWYSEKYFWIGLALSVHFARKTFKEVDFYTDDYGFEMVKNFNLDFDDVDTMFSVIDLPASLWSLPKVYAIAKQTEPFLHIDGDAFLTMPLPVHFLNADVLVQSYEPFDSYNFYQNAVDRFLKESFYLNYDFLYAYAHKLDPVNNGIVGGNNVNLFKMYYHSVFENVDKNMGMFTDEPHPDFCVTLEQWLLTAICKRHGVKITTLLNDLVKDSKAVGYKHYLSKSKRDESRCLRMEIKAAGIIPEQLERINEHFEKVMV